MGFGSYDPRYPLGGLPTVTAEISPEKYSQIGDFYELEKKVARQVALTALRDGTGPMLAAIKSHIRSHSGLLAAGTRVRQARGDREGRVAVLISAWVSAERFAKGQEKMGRAAQALGIRSRFAGHESGRYNVYYSRMVEFGHDGPMGSGERTPEHSFARAGFDETVENAADSIQDRLFEGIENA